MSGRPRRSNRLRIIGGRWRGRKLSFPSLPELRPTPDRVRETLFNWLQPIIEGARCLDLFAGSGALGLEAASRGASAVVLVDWNPSAARQLQEHVRALRARQARVVQADARRWLSQCSAKFDLVFLDPPFDKALLASCCRLLQERRCLAAAARIYLERRGDNAAPELPAGWRLARSKTAGNLSFHLAVAGAPVDRAR